MSAPSTAEASAAAAAAATAVSPPRVGLSHPSLVDLIETVERTTLRLPVASPPGVSSSAGSDDEEDDDGDAVRTRRRRSSDGTGSSMDTADSRQQGNKSSPKKADDEEEEEGYQDMSEGLEGMDVSALRRRVDPIVRALGRVDAVGLLDLDYSPPRRRGAARSGARGRSMLAARVAPDDNADHSFVRPIHSSIVPPRRYDADTCVRYLHIAEASESYSLGVFVFPPHSTIPLHDHPGMCVLSRVLYGELKVRSFDVVRGNRGGESWEEDDDERDFAEVIGNGVAKNALPQARMANGDGGEAAAADAAASLDAEEAAARRKSSFSWVAEALAARGSNIASSFHEEIGDGRNSSGDGDDNSNKVPNRTGSWLSSLLFPYRRESSSLYRKDSSSSSLGGGGAGGGGGGGGAGPRSSSFSDRKPSAYTSKNKIRPKKRSLASLPEGTLRAYRNKVRRVEAPHVQVLYPSEGNAHEFTAGPDGAAVLDVLLPPYDFEHDRDCTFYRAERADGGNDEEDGHDNDDDDEEDESKEGPEAMDGVMKDGHETRPGGGRVASAVEGGPERGLGRGRRRARGPRCHLIPIPQPKNFHCISGTYIDFGSDDEG